MSKVFGRIKGLGLSSLAAVLLLQPLFFGSLTKVYAEGNTAPVFTSNSIYTSNWGSDIAGMYSVYLEPTLKPVVGGQVTISTTINDAESNLVKVRGGVNPNVVDIASDNVNGLANGNYQITSIDTTAYPDGILDIRMEAIDGVLGTESIYNTVSNNYEIVVDNTAPTLDYSTQTPGDMQVVKDTITVDGVFGDNYGLFEIGMALGENVECILGPSSEYVNDTPANGLYFCDIDTTQYEDGTYPIIMVAIDKAGNINEIHSRSIVIDNNTNEPEEPGEDTTAPIFVTKDVTRDEGESIPSLNEFVLNNPENLEVFCSNVDASEMFVSQPANNKLIPVTCYVEDAAGNRTTSTSNLIVNNVLPKVVIIANPSIVVTEGTTVNLIANILNGNEGFTYNWYGSCSGNGTNPSVGLTNFSNVPSNTGSYLCGISVTDADGDVASASVRVDVLAQGANSSTPSNPTTDSNTENTNTTDNTNSNDSEVQGVSTENPVSAPSEEQNTGSTNNTNTTAVNSVVTTSPLVIICLVAGAILIIGLLLFLFFRGDDSEQTNETASA